MPRILRIGSSVAIVVAAYWAYSLIAVPWIEPPAGARWDDPSIAAGEPVDRLAPYRQLFQAGDWELEEGSKILDVDQVKFLWRELTDRGDGSIQLRPCTIIFTPNGGSAVDSERMGEAIVLQGPRGTALTAEVTFDEPFDLRRGSVGRLVNGRLIGPILIRGSGRSPGPEDDLRITTRDLLFTEERIWIAGEVDFRLGPHAGQGAGMQINFRPGDSAGSSRKHGLNIAGVDSVEVQRLDRLRLLVSQASLSGGVPALRPATGGPPATQALLPVEIVCRGPFHFDLSRQLATFKDQVDLRVVYPQGPSDQVSCELLTVRFARRRPGAATAADRPVEATDAKQGSPLAELQPAKVEATGNPVIVHVPSRQVEARGTLLAYDCLSGEVLLEDSQEAFLRQGPPGGLNEIHAPRFRYRHAAGGRVGQVEASGPGRLRAQVPDRPGQPFEARWVGQLRLAPCEEQQLISLTGGAQLSYSLVGNLNAPEIYFWFFEMPAPEGPKGPGGPEQLRAVPDRMMAGRKDGPCRREVRLASAKLSASADRLEVWFDRQIPAGRAVTSIQTVWSPAAATVAEAAGERHFQVDGDLLRAQVAMAGAKPELSKLTVEGSVRLVETRTEQPDDQPLSVTGDRLQVVDASQPHAAITATGSPAHFEGRGLGLTGPNINLNRGTNRLWIDGAGRMDLVVPHEMKLQEQTIPAGASLAVDWKERMTLVDGRTLRFEGSAAAAADPKHLRAEVIEVTFQQPIRFGDGKREPPPKPDEIVCRGNVTMESRNFDKDGQSSQERMEVPELAIRLASGEFRSGGPGRVVLVFRGDGTERISGRPGPRGPANQAGPLNYLEVRFQRGMSGNQSDRKVTFRDGVKAVYGPVPSWNATLSMDRPEALGVRGAVLGCETLSLVQMLATAGSSHPLSMEARGNATVENQSYLAKAVRISYDQSNGLLVLEGDGWTDAGLYLQERVGDQPKEHHARTIHYWPDTGQWKVDRARLLDLSG